MKLKELLGLESVNLTAEKNTLR